MPTITGGNTALHRLRVPSAGAAAAATAAASRATTSRRTRSATAAAAAADELPAPPTDTTTGGRRHRERVAAAGRTGRGGATPGSTTPHEGRPTIAARAGWAGPAAAAADPIAVATAEAAAGE